MADLGPDVPLSVGAFIRQAIGEGLGVTAARSLMRDQGIGRMSNATFGQLFHNIEAAVGERGVIESLDYRVLPPPDVYSTWAAGPGNRYASFVETFIRQQGSRDVSSRWYTYTTDTPHTPQEAIDKARMSMLVEPDETMTIYGDVVLDSVVTSMARTTPRVA